MNNCSWNNFYSREFSMREYLCNLYTHSLLFDEICKESPKSILEIGTGTGIMSLFLSHLGYRVTSLDNNSEIANKAKALNNKWNGNVEYIIADAFKLEKLFKSRTFDIVFSQGFFEHFSDIEINHLINQQLKVGRKIIFSVPSKYYPIKDFGNERLLSIRDWKNILKGFEVDSIKYYGFFLISRKLVFRFIFNPVLIYKSFFGTLLKEQSHIIIKIRF